MATKAELSPRPARRAGRVGGVRSPRWPLAAWASIALAALFVAVTCWWLSRDSSVPVDDAAVHLGSAIDAYEALGAGHLLKALTGAAPYPPLTFLVGALGVLVGGVGVAPPIVALNVVFVPLLALGCYQVGRLAFGPAAGLLAVIFALGSPMVVEEFHEFMLDAPEGAMVALAVWAILATERFSRLGVCALAGLAVGLGLLTKETFVFFVAGVALATAFRGGVRAWRGVAVFTAVALVVALPWYVHELSILHTLGGEAVGSSSHVSGEIPGIAPPRLSLTNLEWYFWSFLNWQLFVPLCAFAAVGVAWTIAAFARRRQLRGVLPELAFGAFVSWAALTETYVHDPRYGIPIVVYVAVFAVGWITRLPRTAGALAAAALALVVLANVLGVGFGVGETVTSAPQNLTEVEQPGVLTVYANYGFWIGPPTRNGDTLGVLRALRREGVRDITVHAEKGTGIEFSPPGLELLARIAGLRVASAAVDPTKVGRSYAFLMHGPPEPGLPRPCIALRDGTGVWIRLGGSSGPRAWSHCPRVGDAIPDKPKA
jgi:4-amino-4-deoxy-L-arabinose transferase-like glycosyltransferase